MYFSNVLKKPIMNVVTLMGIFSAFAFFIPALLILLLRLTVNKSLFALLIYFLITALYNIIGVGIIKVDVPVEKTFFVISNYLDAPLMLLSFLFFCTDKAKRKKIYLCLGIFALYELIITLIYGFGPSTVVYIMGPGIVLILFFAVYFFVHYVKLTIEKNKGFGKTFMSTSIVFAYGCYAMIYFFYYFQPSPMDDVFLIYYIASLVASILMSIGLISYHKRHKQFKDVELTRKELRMFFNTP